MPSVSPRAKLQMLLAQFIFQGEEGKSPRASEQAEYLSSVAGQGMVGRIEVEFH